MSLNPKASLMRSATPLYSADSVRPLERGCRRNTMRDLRDRAFVAILKTTAARGSSLRMLCTSYVDSCRAALWLPSRGTERRQQVLLLPEASDVIIKFMSIGRPSLLGAAPGLRAGGAAWLGFRPFRECRSGRRLVHHPRGNRPPGLPGTWCLAVRRLRYAGPSTAAPGSSSQ